MGIILTPFAWLLTVFYNFSGYGMALILFAIVIKTILFPVTLKGKKSMIKTNMLSGKLQQLQKQYGKDRERYNLEVQKLYAREKVNPMGGCLWSLIPIALLIALYYIIREPLTYFMQLSTEQIQILAEQLDWSTVAVANGWVSQGNMDKLLQQVADGKLTSVFQNGAYNQMYLASLINEGNLASLQAALGEAGSKLFAIDFSFLGLNLAGIPSFNFWSGGITLQSVGLFLLPLVSTAISFLSMKVSMATNRMSTQSTSDQMERTNKIMMYTMPLMSLWIGFTVPAGLSIYWIAQYLITMVQEIICGKMLKKDYEAARAAAAKREQEEKEEEKRRKEEARLERARRAEEEKKNRGKKKPGQKKHEEGEQEGINRDDSREGIRAYARGRAYIPDRFGGVTPYVNPNDLIRAQLQEEAVAKATGRKKKAKAKPEEKKAEAPKTEQAPAAVEQPQESLPEAVTEQEAPAIQESQQTSPAEEPQAVSAPETETQAEEAEDKDKEV